MPAERYYKPIPFFLHEELTFVDHEYHHLVRVMRNVPGDEVEIVNGKGQLALAKIQSVEKKAAHLKIEKVIEEKPPRIEVIIAQAIPRLNRLDFILEKGTELGMTQLWLFPGELSEKRTFSPTQLDRIQNVLIAAMKQCGRLYLPKVEIISDIPTWRPFEYDCFYGDLSPEAKPFVKELKSNGNIIFCVGPEGGFTENEIRMLKKIGCKGVKLHYNTLRTDTASLVALSLIAQADA